MATRKNPKVSLPKQWTNAQVRVNPQGKVQVKIAKNKVTNPDYIGPSSSGLYFWGGKWRSRPPKPGEKAPRGTLSAGQATRDYSASARGRYIGKRRRK